MSYQPHAARYDSAPKSWFRRCGRSGLMLPALSLGCWNNFGGPGTDSAKHADEASFHENCRQMLFTAFDAGITHFDLANNYGPPPGAAEERVGRILKEDFAGLRDELLISTKAGWGMWPGPYGDWGSRKYLLASLDASLQRLKLNYVDIFYTHRPDPNTPLEETIGALDHAVRSGKALYAGISSYSGAATADIIRICEQNHFHKPIIHQPSYSMLNRWVEPDLLPVTARFGIGTIAFCPLDQGVLTSKYLSGIPADSRAGSGNMFLRPGNITEEKVAKLRKLNAVAQKRGQTLAQMALVWVLRPQNGTAVTSALIGASRPQQIKENVAAMSKPDFAAEELAELETILKS